MRKFTLSDTTNYSNKRLFEVVEIFQRLIL